MYSAQNMHKNNKRNSKLEKENKALISKFLKLKKYEIINTNFKTNAGVIEYIVKEKFDDKLKLKNIIYFSDNKRLNKKLKEKYQDETENEKSIRKSNVRFIIVQTLNFINYKREFNKKKISKIYLKKRNVIKNIFSYLTVNNIKESVYLDVIQIFNYNGIKKIKYRKNVSNITNMTNFNLLRNVV